jgi:hypothetical protein
MSEEITLKELRDFARGKEGIKAIIVNDDLFLKLAGEFLSLETLSLDAPDPRQGVVTRILLNSVPVMSDKVLTPDAVEWIRKR